MAPALGRQMKGPDSECDPRLEQGKMREAGKMESPVTQKHGRSILDREQHTGIPNKEPGESQGAERHMIQVSSELLSPHLAREKCYF